MSGTIRILIAGQPWFVPTGISVAAALALTDNPITRLSVSGQPRTPFCGMGVCQECRVSVN
ncbi:(2Fe-2S)-binding protein, partial [Escherichia coli]|nr:(2Fe-2S)-binding protein [Escherichia coli]